LYWGFGAPRLSIAAALYYLGEELTSKHVTSEHVFGGVE
jgi:hypothetical protein